MDTNEITGAIIDATMYMHTALGPGLLESAYEACLKYELASRNFNVLSQVELPVIYKNNKISAGYRIDLLVEEQIIVELKAVDKIIAIHEAQILSYLKLSGKSIGLLINFNVMRLKYGIKRFAN